ncbi:hypothetical protein [Rhodococcus sp. ZPP]|uniref:hypothetical protein n=1 Tax=Rhodococcus sp. ZPP TaxID=2749906 RepID=UPI001FCBC311|nr:hypothetical protein [Rhodococcus sp. ZPP]
MRITRRKADDLLSGSIPLLNASGRIVPDRLVSDVLTTYMRGSGIGPAGVMVMLDIADDARVPDQAALDNCVSVNSYGHCQPIPRSTTGCAQPGTSPRMM